MAEVCGATVARCCCGLEPHGPETPHECKEPDPTCGGSWLDHPTDPDRMLVVRWPGIRGNPETMKVAAEEYPSLTDPPPGEPSDEPRPMEMVYFPGLGYFPRRVRAPRGGIKFYPPPDLEEITNG
jgi:hypothetical protein